MSFFRYIFLITILVGSTSIGFLLSKSYEERLKELKNILNLVNILKNKIMFTKKPLGELLEEISEIERENEISKIFIKTAEELKKESFEKAWQDALYEETFFLNLKKEDIRLLETFGNMMGKTDIEGQINEINQFLILLNGQISNVEEEKNKNSKMYKSLGTIIGLGIVVILF